MSQLGMSRWHWEGTSGVGRWGRGGERADDLTLVKANSSAPLR